MIGNYGMIIGEKIVLKPPHHPQIKKTNEHFTQGFSVLMKSDKEIHSQNPRFVSLP